VDGFRSITAFVPEEASTLGLGLVSSVFGDRRHLGLPGFDITFCTDHPGSVTTDAGLRLSVEHGVDRLAEGDLVLLLPGDSFRGEPSAEVLGAVRAAYARGAIVASHCVGSWILAATGLLDGLRATTHWRLAGEFAARYPNVRVEPGVLYVDEGRLLTGAGAGAGTDLYLHLLRREHGASVANTIARDIVVPPHRDGGQAQYIETPVPASGDDARLAAALEWASGNLHRTVPVEEMAARALMSPRTFARRFKAATGTTPHAWLLRQRLVQAEALLEQTSLSIEEVARQVGYASATVLRERFLKHRGVPPREYRRAFAGGP
jgi:transcriptional regulator GlxA family with amidase domain